MPLSKHQAAINQVRWIVAQRQNLLLVVDGVTKCIAEQFARINQEGDATIFADDQLAEIARVYARFVKKPDSITEDKLRYLSNSARFKKHAIESEFSYYLDRLADCIALGDDKPCFSKVESDVIKFLHAKYVLGDDAQKPICFSHDSWVDGRIVKKSQQNRSTNRP